LCAADKHIVVYRPRDEHTWDTVSSKRDVSVSSMSNNADTTDLAWSPDCVRLAVGGVDASVTIWDSGRREAMFTRKDHRSFVQGVAWDPADRLLASQSSDRSLALLRVPAVFGRPDSSGKRRRKKNAATVMPQRECAPIKTVSAPGPADAPGDKAQGKADKPASRSLWLPESTPTFFRRPAFSPDASLLVCPTGQARLATQPDGSSAVVAPGRASDGALVPATHVFVRGSWGAPAMHLPHKASASVAASFAPCLFRSAATPSSGALAAATEPAASSSASAASAGGTAPAPLATGGLGLPYSMLLAVATLDGVTVYDTAEGRAVAHAAHIHMERLTDVAWSGTGRLVATASMDGYVSIIALSREETGAPIPQSQLPAPLRRPVPAKHGAPAAKKPKPAAAPAEAAAARAPAAAAPAAAAGGVTVLKPRKRATATLVSPPARADKRDRSEEEDGRVVVGPTLPELNAAASDVAAKPAAADAAGKPKRKRAALVVVAAAP